MSRPSSSDAALAFLVPTLLLLAACGDKADDDTGSTGGEVDVDGDGFTEDEDCDDNNSGVYPGAEEVCNDADDDCDGTVDNDASDAGTWYADADGDGFGDGDTPYTGCEAPDGYVDGPDDCDDTSADINPSVDEVCNDLDDNCDEGVDEGVTTTFYGDADRDGFGDDDSTTEACDQPPDTASVGGDCDDEDETVYPGAEEVCADGVVNDCEGTVEDALSECPLTWDESLATSALEFTGTGGSSYTGNAVASGDVDGDGLDDLLVGAPYYDNEGTDRGAAYLVLGGATAGSSLAAADVSGAGEYSYSYLGYDVDVAPDVDGDGIDDVLVGAPSNGEGTIGVTYLVLGSTTADFEDPDGFLEPDTNGRAGQAVAGVGDVDGDGLGDVLIGNPYYYDEGYQGRAYLVYGPGTGTTSAADVTLSSESSGNVFTGKAVAGVGDVNGDGMHDMLVSAPSVTVSGLQSGRAYLIHGGASLADGTVADMAAATLQSGELGAYVGDSLDGAGDFDGDGMDDIVVGAPSSDTVTSNGGAAYVFLGTVSGPTAAADAAATFTGSETHGFAGRAVAGAGDMDGDGLSEVLVGEPGDWIEGADTGGSVYVMLGGSSGGVTAATAVTSTSGETARDGAGLSLAAGDFDGDGIPDAMIGAPGTGESNLGSAFVLLNDLTY